MSLISKKKIDDSSYLDDVDGNRSKGNPMHERPSAGREEAVRVGY
jgi:hypothetical protein